MYGRGPLIRANGWEDQADVLLRTRLAADGAGATPLPPPGRIAVGSGTTARQVVCALGARRAVGCEATGSGSRSRITGVAMPSLAGNLIRLREHGGDPTATAFLWSDEELSGQGLRQISAEPQTERAPTVRDLQYDAQGHLWAVLEAEGTPSDELVSVNTASGTTRRVVTARQGAELTAVAVADDNRQIFVAACTPGAVQERRSVVLSVRRPRA